MLVKITSLSERHATAMIRTNVWAPFVVNGPNVLVQGALGTKAPSTNLTRVRSQLEMYAIDVLLAVPFSSKA